MEFLSRDGYLYSMERKTLRLDFSDIQTFLVASQKDLFRSIVDTMDPQRYTKSRERFHYLTIDRSCVRNPAFLFSFFFFFCRKSLAAGFHFRGTNWSYSAVYAITWSPVIDCVPTNCRGCNELITSPADNRRDGQMVKSSSHRPPPGQGFRTQGSRNVWETGKSRGVSSFFFHEKRDPVLGCVASLLTIRFEWIFEEKKKRKERNSDPIDFSPALEEGRGSAYAKSIYRCYYSNHSEYTGDSCVSFQGGKKLRLARSKGVH